jgi:PKD repeat protein
LSSDDNLTYQRRFSPEQHVVVNEIVEEWKRILVSFEEKWDFAIKLTVNDNYGKLSEIEKSLTIESTLRPQLFISPVATFWWAAVRFLTKSNKDVVFFEWDLGDGETREISTPAMTHSYDQVWVYEVSLTVYTEDDEYNSITKQVFIGEKDSPIVAYEVTNRANRILKQEALCDVDWTWQASFFVARGEEITIDVSKSVNTKWEKNWLEVYFQPENDDIFKQNKFKYKFVDLWCQFVDIKAEDSIAGVISTQRVWFKIVNDLPTLQNLLLQFRQYGNNIGIWLETQQTTQQDNTFEATDFSNLIVKVVAQWPNDADGAIAFYKWSYFNKDNPGRILETKVTPANIPETYFTLQKIPGEWPHHEKGKDQRVSYWMILC